MSNYGCPTTLRFPRTARQSGTELANTIEHHRRTDTSGVVIVAVVLAPIVCAFVGHLLGAFL